jgi:hypothetical protein
VISVETSTPKARAFIEEFLGSPVLSKARATLTSRELRAVVSDSPPADLTNPMSEPFPDVIQDLSQLSTLTASYLGRAMAGAILLATGILRNDPIAIVVAALFLPFLSQVLAVSFGAWSGDWKLARQGTVAVIASTIAAVLAGALVAKIEGGPILFSSFKGPLASFAISAVIGLPPVFHAPTTPAGDTSLGSPVRCNSPYSRSGLGSPGERSSGKTVIAERLLSFGINLVTLSATAALAYAALHFKDGWKAPRRGRISL